MNDPYFPIVASDPHPLNVLDYELTEHRSIYLSGVIDDRTAQSVIAQLRYLDAKDNDTIYLFINSPGGFFPACLAIYDCMKHGICSDIATVAIGHTASTATLLLAAGAKDMRYAALNAEILLPARDIVLRPSADTAFSDNHLDLVRRKLASLLAQCCGKTLDQLLADTRYEVWMHAVEAREYGLVDHIGYPLLEERAINDELQFHFDNFPFDDVPEPTPLRNVTLEGTDTLSPLHPAAPEEDDWPDEFPDEELLRCFEEEPDVPADYHGVILLSFFESRPPIVGAICEHTNHSIREALDILSNLPHTFSFPTETQAEQFIRSISAAGGAAIFDLPGSPR